MANPYIVGGRVPHSQLYGRDELIQKCYQDVSKNNIWLLGRRRSGKTSVLYAIEECALERKEWFPVYIDMLQCFSDADIKKSFLRKCQENLKKIGIEEEYQPPEEEHDFADLVDDVCRWLNERDIKLLLLLDEIERIEKLGEEGSKLVSKLQAVIGGREPRPRMIIASSRVLRTRKEVVTTPFIGLFRIEYIGAISEKEARKLIRQEKNAEIKIQVADEVIDETLTVSACEPYLCQYLCDKLYQQDNSLRVPTDADLTQLDANLNEILAVDYRYLEEKEKEILLRIARGEQTESLSVPSELIKLGYIKLVNNQYRIGNHFLATWLQANVMQEQTDGLSGPSESPISQQPSQPAQPSRLVDLGVSMLILIVGFGFIMGEYAVLVAKLKLTNFQAVLVGLVTAILGFPILTFVGVVIKVIGESTFYKLFLKIIGLIPLLANLADQLISVTKAWKGQAKNGNSEE